MRENLNHMVKCKTRYTALAMSAILVFTTVLGNTSIAALAYEAKSSSSIVFELDAADLQEEALSALESGDLFDTTEFFGEDLPRAYDRLFLEDDGWGIYEFTPSVENSISEKVSLRTFVHAKEGASRLSDDAEIVFLFVNHSKNTLDFSVSVDGYTTRPVSVEGLSAATASNANAASADDGSNEASIKASASNTTYDDDSDDDDDEYDFEIELINDLEVEDNSETGSLAATLSAAAMDSVALADGGNARALHVDIKELRKTNASNGQFPAFYPEPIVFDDVTITLSAPAGVIPAGTTVSAERVAQEDLNRLMDELQNPQDTSAQKDLDTYSEDEVQAPIVLSRIGFDITLYDAEGSPVTFEDGTVTVSFQGTLIEEMTRDANAAAISHVDFKSKTVENIASEEFPVEEALEQVAFEAEHFSTYVFETMVKSELKTSNELEGKELSVGFTGFSNRLLERGIWENGTGYIAYCHNHNQSSPGGYRENELVKKLGSKSLFFTSETETLTPAPDRTNIELIDDNSTKKVKKVVINKSGSPIEYQNPLYFKHSYEDVINSDWIFDYDNTEQASENIDKIMNLLYAGYPYDSFGLAKKHLASMGEATANSTAYLMTQSLLWYLCDRDGKFDSGFSPSQIESILSNDSPTTPLEKYTQALYDAISNENCRTPRLHLSGDTTMTTEDNRYYKSGLINTYSGFGGVFAFTSIPDGYEIHLEDGTPVKAGTELEVGKSSFYIATENPVLADDTNKITLSIDYIHTASTLSYYRYINKEITDSGLNTEIELSGIRSYGYNTVTKTTNAYQDLVRLELLNDTTNIGLTATIIPGDDPVVDPEPEPNPEPSPEPDPEPNPGPDPEPDDPKPNPGPNPEPEPEPNPGPNPEPDEPNPDNNNNNNNSSNGNGGGGNRDNTPSTGTITVGENPAAPVVIEEEAVPMANLPSIPNDASTVNIEDEPVPLAALPKTGQNSAHTLPLMALSGMLLALVGLFTRKKPSDEQ